MLLRLSLALSLLTSHLLKKAFILRERGVCVYCAAAAVLVRIFLFFLIDFNESATIFSL
jgi:hypothetical protein